MGSSNSKFFQQTFAFSMSARETLEKDVSGEFVPIYVN